MRRNGFHYTDRYRSLFAKRYKSVLFLHVYIKTHGAPWWFGEPESYRFYRWQQETALLKFKNNFATWIFKDIEAEDFSRA